MKHDYRLVPQYPSLTMLDRKGKSRKIPRRAWASTEVAKHSTLETRRARWMPNAVERHRRGVEVKCKLQEGRSRKCVIYVCRLKFLFPEARQPMLFVEILLFCFRFVFFLCFSMWLDSVVVFYMIFLCFVCFC